MNGKGQAASWFVPALDGVRALAILLVMAHHFVIYGLLSGLAIGPSVLAYVGLFGFSGVLLFFVLSGFLLFLPYARALLHGTPWPSPWRFYQRRALRILPGYWVVLGLLLALVPGSYLVSHLGDIALAVLLLHDWTVSAYVLTHQLDTPLWTLAIEWQFYLVLPWLALALARLAGARAGRWFLLRLFAGLGSLMVLGLLIRGLAAQVHYADGVTYPITLPGVGWVFSLVYGIKGKYLEVFALGMALAVVSVALEKRPLSRARQWEIGWCALCFSLIGMLLCLVWALAAHRIGFGLTDWIFPVSGQAWAIWGEWVLGLCFAVLVMALVLGPAPVRWVFELLPVRAIGKISYSLYLWHLPILVTLLPFCHSVGQWVFVGGGVSVLIAGLSYWLIERPFLRHRRAALVPSSFQGAVKMPARSRKAGSPRS